MQASRVLFLLAAAYRRGLGIDHGFLCSARESFDIWNEVDGAMRRCRFIARHSDLKPACSCLTSAVRGEEIPDHGG
jgi:hypothetical protein